MISTSTAARPRPLYQALTLAAAAMAATVTAAVLLGRMAPDMAPVQQRLIAVLLLAVLAAAAAMATERTMFTAGRIEARLLAVPAVVALAPFAGGLKDPGPEAAAVLVAGYLATGIYEELWFRGLILRSLCSWTPLRGALFSAALFGLAHLANLAFGANPAITAAQVVGTACFGVGFAALRLRGMPIWPLIILHALTDIGLQLGDVGSAWRWGLMVGGDTVLLVFGLALLRRPAAVPAGTA